MKVYKNGLNIMSTEPCILYLSAIFAGFQLGFRKTFGDKNVKQIGMGLTYIQDGSLDFYVPNRYESWERGFRFIPLLLRRIKLAWEVVRGRADILYYR